MERPPNTTAPPFAFPERTDRLGAHWIKLNRATISLVAWVAVSAAAVYLVALLVTRQWFFFRLLVLGLSIGVVAIWQGRRDSEDATLVLSFTAISVVIASAMSPPLFAVALWSTLSIVASIGALMIPERSRTRFLVLIGILLAAEGLWPWLGIADSSGVVIGMVATGAATTAGVVVVTMTRRTLDRSDQSRVGIFRRVPVGLFRTDPDGVILDANPALLNMLGYEDSSLIGRNAPRVHGDHARWLELIDDVSTTTDPQRITWPLRTLDNRRIWVRGFIQAIFDEEGTLQSLDGALEDVTARRQVEKESRLHAERFKAVFERAPIAIWEENFVAVGEELDRLRREGLTDLEAYLSERPDETMRLVGLVEYVDVNPAGAELIGASSKQEALQRVVAPEPTPEVLDSFIRQFVAIWDDQDHLEIDITGSTVDGDPIDLVLSWASARDADGALDLNHVVVAIADVHIIRQAERELAALINSKDELVASVSHELRTPITTILGMAYELRDHAEAFSQTEIQEFIALIADQSRELSNIVDDLLVAARTDLDTLAVRPEVIDLHEEVELTVASTMPEARPSIITDGRTLAWADPLRFRQIVRNLLTNARRYGGPTVMVEAGKRNGEAYLRVKDDGPGVPPNDRESIFEPYTRSSSDKGLPGSIGLGLPVSRRLARLMGGELRYRYEDAHSVFELTLPEPARMKVA